MNEKGTKLNNKGFSLVEIIIVIAVMAILTGIIAPQVLGYVEESRRAKDLQLVNSVFTAVQTGFAIKAPTADIEDATISTVTTNYKKVKDILGNDLDTVEDIRGKAKSDAGKTGTLYVKYVKSTGELKVYIAPEAGEDKATIGPVANY